MKKKISFIHAADLHLDSPFNGLSDLHETQFQEVRESTFKALENLVTTAIKREVDFIVLVGDLFDNDKQSLKAQIKLRNAFEKLQAHQIDVYVSYGNHDYTSGNIYPITYPENVHIFQDEQVRSFTYVKDNTPLAMIYGFSYENRAVIHNKAHEYKKGDATIPFHIAMLHGSIESNTDHDTYAPFQVGQLVQADFDYWALGHIHKREILKENPYIIYPGNIQGRNRKEIGPKGCYYVELTETQQLVEFVPLQAVQYHTLTVDLVDCDSIHQVEEILTNTLKKIPASVPQLLDVSIRGGTKLWEWKNDDVLDELIEIINESFSSQRNWLYIFRYSVIEGETVHQLEGDYFIGEIKNKLEEFTGGEHISEIYQHKEARKYLDHLDADELKEINKEAYELLIHKLFQE
ncbi:metallophosphoesterase family protein [Ornithinibacillus scapharcae]|uniref:metallophosphoesterase family protein n=1 Tax=Ornithinibacillus scapharcae TaxID=1147159 RepID=UPI000225B7B4|nr:DNA repair exonuclease [Ornithinibacillus scapharcae]